MSSPAPLRILRLSITYYPDSPWDEIRQQALALHEAVALYIDAPGTHPEACGRLTFYFPAPTFSAFFRVIPYKFLLRNYFHSPTFTIHFYYP